MKRGRAGGFGEARASNSGSVEPEYEINEELAEEVTEANGETHLEASEDTIKAEGALNAEAAQENRRKTKIVARKDGGDKKVSWGENRATILYDNILRMFPANTMAIYFERLSGSPIGGYLEGQPKNGLALYQAIQKQVHRRHEEAEYKISFYDIQKGFNRGVGRITLPSTLDEPMLGDAPAPPPPPNAAPYGSGHPVFWPQPHSAPVAPQPQMPAGATPEMMNAMFSFMSDMFTKMMPPGGMVAPQAAAPPQRGAPILATPAPAMPQVIPGPNGAVFVPGHGWMIPASTPQQSAAPPAISVPIPKSPAEQFKESVSLITVAVDAANAMKALIPVAAPAAEAATPETPKADDSPMKTIKVGDLNIVVNEDGSTRLIETAMANGEKIMGWVEKQRKALQAAQQPQQPGVPQQVSVPQANGPAMTMPTWPTR